MSYHCQPPADQKRMNSLLRASRVLQGSDDGFWEWSDLAKDELWWSPQVYEMLGYEEDEFVPTHERFLAMVHPDDREGISARLKHLTEEEPFQAEYRIQTKAGEYLWFQGRGIIFRDDNGKPCCMSGTVRDVTQRHEAVAKLEKSEELFRWSFESSANAMAITDLQGRFTQVNDAACQVFGFTREELLLKGVSDITLPEDLDASLENFRALLSGDVDHYTIEKRYRHKKGHILWGTLSASIVKDSDGEPSYVLAQLQDNTARKLAEDSLKTSELWFRSLIELCGSMFMVLDKEGFISYVSPSINRMLGWQPEELLETDAFRLIHDDDFANTRQAFERALASPANEETAEFRYRHRDDSWRWLRAVGINYLDNDAVQGIVVAAQEISDLKQTEFALQQSEASLQKAQKIAHLGNWEMDVETTRISWSDEVSRIFGFDPDAVNLTFDTFLDRVYPDDRQLIVQLRETLASQGHADFEYRMIRQDGEVRWIFGRGEADFNHLGEPTRMFGVLQDVTERKQAEEALRKREAQLASAVEIAKLGLWEADVESGVFTFTDSFYKVFRTTAEEMGGYQMAQTEYARRFVHPDDAHLVQTEGRKAIEADDPNYSSSLDHRILYADGSVGHIAVRGLIVKDQQGKTVKTYGVNQDITERKQAEEQLQHPPSPSGIAVPDFCSSNRRSAAARDSSAPRSRGEYSDWLSTLRD